MRVYSSANETEGQDGWNAINWRSTHRRVRNLRQRIFKAERQGNIQKVKSLQKLMLRSHANLLVSIRRVTQMNAGKGTAGIDKVVVKTPEARMKLVQEMVQTQPWKAQPAKRVYIPKANGKQRPLGIPTVRDRVMQARVKNALEPQWEARFEATSYGFRPGRGCHDAIAAIFNYANPLGRRKWVIDADIKGAFDNIDHARLLSLIGSFPARELVKQWLKAGYVEGGVEYETPAGTPQGGVISPLLANIALHGMEEALGIKRSDQGRLHRNCPRAVVRYADDFVVFCESRKDAEEARQTLREWLNDRGLELSEEKTTVVHISVGFDFLGFNIRQFSQTSSSSGAKVIIRPSKASVQKIRNRLREEWKALNGANAAVVVKRLNPIIRGWANYFRIGAASRIFSSLDTWMFKWAWKYARRNHPGKSAEWTRNRYFGRRNPRRNDNWVLGDEQTGKYLNKFAWHKIERHVLVVGKSSPDDPALSKYWVKRSGLTAKERLIPSLRGLARQQSYRCPVCNEALANGERLERHHMILDRADEARNQRENQMLLHLYCHDQVHGGKTARQSIVKEFIRNA